MVRRAESLWPEVRPFHQKHHYTAADQKAAAVLAPLPKPAAPALRKQHAALRAEARAWHEAKLKGAGPGGTALHAGLANRFGGAHKTTLADLRAQAEVAVQAMAGGGRCTTQEAAVARRARASGARKAQVTVTLSRCGSDAKERTASEQYTYTVQVPYQVTKSVKVRSERYVVSRKTCTRKMPGPICRRGGWSRP